MLDQLSVTGWPKVIVFDEAEIVTVGAGVLTLIEVEVPVIEDSTVSVAVMVSLGPVFRVAEKVPVPFVSVELVGSTAWASELEK